MLHVTFNNVFRSLVTEKTLQTLKGARAQTIGLKSTYLKI